MDLIKCRAAKAVPVIQQPLHDSKQCINWCLQASAGKTAESRDEWVGSVFVYSSKLSDYQSYVLMSEHSVYR